MASFPSDRKTLEVPSTAYHGDLVASLDASGHRLPAGDIRAPRAEYLPTDDAKSDLEVILNSELEKFKSNLRRMLQDEFNHAPQILIKTVGQKLNTRLNESRDLLRQDALRSLNLARWSAENTKQTFGNMTRVQEQPDMSSSSLEDGEIAEDRVTSLPSNLDGSAGGTAVRGPQGSRGGTVNGGRLSTENSKPFDAPVQQRDLRSKKTKHERAVRQGRELIARAVLEWMLCDGCRQKAPETEQQVVVSDQWVSKTGEACLNSIEEKLHFYKEYETAFNGLWKRMVCMGCAEVDTSWLLVGPTPENIRKARCNYKKWDPPLQDYEWETERKVLCKIAQEVISAERDIKTTGMDTTDPFERAVICTEVAQFRIATSTDK